MRMKKTLTILMLVAFTLGVGAQLSLIPFETAVDRTHWSGFSNQPDAAGDLTIVANPDKSGINTTDSCLKFIVNATADLWVGGYSDDFGPINITANEHTLTMMVYKTIISPCGMKVEQSTNGGPATEKEVSNTVINQWERISFDLSGAVGYSYGRLTFFPDFPDTRTGGTTVYLDNFQGAANLSTRSLSETSIMVYPNPADEILSVQAPDMTGYTITNMIGQTIRKDKFQTVNNRSVDISDMPAGVYFITIESLNGSYTSKFMVR
jgi:hypothetical protein